MRAILAVLLAAVCFGTTGTAQALGPSADPVALGAARIAVGGIALAVVAALTERRRSRRTSGAGGPAATAPSRAAPSRAASGAAASVGARAADARAADAPAADAGAADARAGDDRATDARTRTASRRRGLTAVAPRTWVAVALGALGVLAYQPAFFAGTARNGVAIGTVVALGSAPVITGVATWALGRGRPGRAWLVATTLATTGVVVLGLAPAGGASGAAAPGGLDVVGVLASVGAGAAYALYTLAGAALIRHGWSSTTSMGAMFGVAGVLSVGVLAAVGAGALASGPGVATVLWLGLVTTTLAYVLFGYGLARLGAPTVATLTLGEPLTATVLGLAVLGERLSGGAVGGLGVLAAGLVVLAVGARPPRLARG